jgi:hypothetical protein
MALTSKQQSVIKLATADEAVREHFFRHAEGMIWFDSLIGQGLLSPTHNPPPFAAAEGEGYVVPYWTALDYVVRTAKGLRQDDLEAGRKILAFARDVSDYARAHEIDNYRTYARIAEIAAAVPPALLEKEDIARARTWLHSKFANSLVGDELSTLIARLLTREDQTGKDLALALFDVLTEIRISGEDERDERVKAVLEPYWLKELLQKRTTDLVTQIGLPVVDLLIHRVELISDKLGWQDRSHWFRHAIEDHEQDDYRDYSPSAIFVSAARDALYMWSGRAGAASRVQQLLHAKVSIVTRLAISAIDRNYDNLKDLIAAALAPQFFVDENRHELYVLLRNHFPKLGKTLQGIALATIESLKVASEDPAESERWTAYVRLQWLHALKDVDDAEAKTAYGKYRSITGQDPQHPDFTSYTESGYVVHKSPKSSEELGAMEPSALIEFANSFKGSDSFWRNEPDEDGLADAIEQAAKLNRERFVSQLSSFKGLRPRYLSRLIMGLRSTDERVFSYSLGETASALSELLLSDDGCLVRAQEKEVSAELDYLVLETCRLVQGALNQAGSDAAAYDTCADFLTRLMPFTSSNREPTLRGAVGRAINSAKGVCTEALIRYALARRRNLQETEVPEVAWNSIAKTFEEQADKLSEGNYEFATVIGNFLPNLMYLSREWVTRRFQNFFSKEQDSTWRCAHEGLSYSRGVHNEVFDLLNEHGEFVRALESNFDGTHVHEFLVQQIGMQYLRGREAIDARNGQLAWLMNKWNPEQISKLVQFLWQVRDAHDIDVRARGVALWKEISRRALVDPKLNRRLLSRLTMLSAWIDRLDDPESLEILRSTAPYAARGHNEATLVKELRRLAAGFPQQSLTVFLEVMKDSAPTYDQEDIRELLRTLVEAGYSAEVREICRRYSRHGLISVIEPIVQLLD